MLEDTKTRVVPSWLLLGPAFVAAIAYVDPGNVAANVSAGAQFGYLLVWVIVVANAMAGLVQYLSAKLGLVTGRTLPEVVADHTRTPTRIAYWLQAELVAVATDLAEVVGGAIALHLLFDLPLLVGGVITGAVSLLLLSVQNRRGQGVFERVITGLLMIIAIGFLTSLFVKTPPAAEVAAGLIPRFQGAESLLLATAMLGATVMPHAVYLHSGLARDRHGHLQPGAVRRRLLRITRYDVGLAMLLAGAVNLAMLLVAATNLQGHDNTDSIEGAHAAVRDTLGSTVALLFAIGLLASGLASTSVGAYAGAMIMQGLLRRSYPLLLRRLVTLIPALVILAIGVDPSRALVLSQVVLSFGIPLALIPLVRLTSKASLMGDDVNHKVTTGLGWGVAGLISVLNVVLIYLTVTG
ncbi:MULTISPECIES: Nramp family divalent metal transporter [Mycolicibacterium]|uniref:Natural resistance-associated macrophage protein metal ion transporter NRAMP n=1 Tax=Mycolicibacterium senegalense TaxID=1796 RepID=A0A378SW99_9MYCO|nr:MULTISPECIES: Nramp family divalent metal transporter [Mycolicibacterium]MCV7334142.1 Nramp family divalent metal transporter [Mycolicibacterium senegalense]MDR7292194.1 manganese transport protein [Mycolicibacterium senegalense]QZA23589.1 Nramp family divalent metal transporter [Mycolicibacterium senegalense]CDP88589.1 manganese transporter MntH [Mycolicibacterium farcinogenes]STZ52753.1 natural resistance-associated macrophage protein metal ion transporter NRAMP [Mycolicibacterium senegal